MHVSVLSVPFFVLAWGTAQVPPDVPTLPVQAEIVLVEVSVTDKKGRPVRNLAAEEFELFEDGRPNPIIRFDPPASASSASSRNPRAIAETGEPVRVPPSPDAPLLVIYLDNRNLTPPGRRRVLDGFASVLERQMSGGHLRVLVTAEAQGTHFMSAATSDPAAATRALAEAATAPVQGTLAAADERATLDTVRSLVEGAEASNQSCLDVFPLLQSVVRAHANARLIHHRETMARLAALLAALGTFPGSKSLLYFTEGLEQRPGVALYHQLGDICPEVLERDSSTFSAPMFENDLARALRELSAQASTARVTIYPVDAAGLRAPSIADVSYDSRRYAPSPRNDSVREANLRSGPWILAEESGGLALFEHNLPSGAVARLIEDQRDRYALGFAPAREADGRRHTLRVEVRRKGLRVRHRLSYWHAPPADAQVRKTYAALLLGYEEDTLGARIEVATVPDTDPDAESEVRLSLPLDRLATRPEATGRQARVRLVMAVRSGGGALEERSEVREKAIDIHLPAGDPPHDGSELRHEIVVRLPVAVREREVAVGVRDLLGGLETYRRLVLGR